MIYQFADIIAAGFLVLASVTVVALSLVMGGKKK